jgi:hypothetical protein
MSHTTRVSGVAGRLRISRWPRQTWCARSSWVFSVSPVSACTAASCAQIRAQIRFLTCADGDRNPGPRLLADAPTRGLRDGLAHAAVVQGRRFLRPGLDLRSRRGALRSGRRPMALLLALPLGARIRRRLGGLSAGHAHDCACDAHRPSFGTVCCEVVRDESPATLKSGRSAVRPCP